MQQLSWSTSLCLFNLIWMDKWLETPLVDQVGEHSVSRLPTAGYVYSESRGWDLPPSFCSSFSVLTSEIEGVVVSPDPNSRVWMSSLDGEVSYAAAYASIRGLVFLSVEGKWIWVAYIPPSPLRFIPAWQAVYWCWFACPRLHFSFPRLTSLCCRGRFGNSFWSVLYVGFVKCGVLCFWISSLPRWVCSKSLERGDDGSHLVLSFGLFGRLALFLFFG